MLLLSFHTNVHKQMRLPLSRIFIKSPESSLEEIIINEACIGILGIQDICHFTSRDMGYFVQYFRYFHGY